MDLEDVSYEVCMCLGDLMGELDLKWAQIASSSGMCWQLQPSWEVGMELEEFELEPDISWGFS